MKEKPVTTQRTQGEATTRGPRGGAGIRPLDAGACARERILEAADVLFGELGFDAAATRLIAERSGVNKALIHYHYSTKDALFGAVLDRYYARLAAAVRPALVAPLPPREKLLGVVEAYVDFLWVHRNFHRLVQREIAGERHLDRVLAGTLPLFAAGTEALMAAWPATREGDLRAADLLVSFHGMIISSFTYAPVLARLLEVDPLSTEALSNRKAHLRLMASLVVDALEGQETEASRPLGRGHRRFGRAPTAKDHRRRQGTTARPSNRRQTP